jgi:transposase
MMPSYRRRMRTASVGRRAGPAHQVQPSAARAMPCPGRQPHHTSTLAALGSNQGVLLAKRSRSRRTRSAARHGAAAHAGDAKDTRYELSRIDMPNVSRLGDLLKILWHDGLGMSLYAKRLERGRFIWPSPTDGVVSITAAQLGYMLEGIDWRNPQRPGGRNWPDNLKRLVALLKFCVHDYGRV